MAGKLCMACNDRPAAAGSGPVDLCAQCRKLAEGKSRGVEFEKAPSTPPTN